MSRYTFACRQLFNTFGAPGIPRTYRAYLYCDGEQVDYMDFCFRARAERQCLRWRELFDAEPDLW